MNAFIRPDRASIEQFIIRDVASRGPVIGVYGKQIIYRSIVDNSGRTYNFVGVLHKKLNNGFTSPTLRSFEFILPPGLIYRMQVQDNRCWGNVIFRMLALARRRWVGDQRRRFE